jgi:hypothetical protein
VEKVICEQVPAFNLQKTYCSWLGDDSPPLSGGGGSSPPEQERVNVMASPKVAASAIFENCVLIVFPPFLWVKNSNAKGSHGGLPVQKIPGNP